MGANHMINPLLSSYKETVMSWSHGQTFEGMGDKCLATVRNDRIDLMVLYLSADRDE